MVLCKGAKREQSHAQDAFASEHGEHPPLAQVLSVCWLSDQAMGASGAQGIIPLSLVSLSEPSEGAIGDRSFKQLVGLKADTIYPQGEALVLE